MGVNTTGGGRGAPGEVIVLVKEFSACSLGDCTGVTGSACLGKGGGGEGFFPLQLLSLHALSTTMHADAVTIDHY